MKKILFLLSIIVCYETFAQQQYETVKAIHYYADSINRKDAYTDSQCVIDLYYPKDKKDFATIVWFHGGGLTGGHRVIPEQLMNQGYAVVGVGNTERAIVHQTHRFARCDNRSPTRFSDQFGDGWSGDILSVR